MESVCQIKQLLQARRGRPSQSWKPFSLTAKTRLTGNAACVCSRSRTNIVAPPEGGGGVRVPRPGGSVKSCSDIPLPPRPTHSFFPLKIACELNIRKCARLSSTTAPSTEAVNHTCTSQQCPFVRLCPLKSRTEESPEDLQREIRSRR